MSLKRKMAGMKTRNILIVIGVIFLVWIAKVSGGFETTWNSVTSWLSPGFTDKDVTDAEQNVRGQFAAREDTKVVEVKMISESARKLVGYVRFQYAGLGLEMEISDKCTATMSDSSRYTVFSCSVSNISPAPALPPNSPRPGEPSGLGQGAALEK